MTETAAELGWVNPTSFIEAFRAAVGDPPGQYASRTRTERGTDGEDSGRGGPAPAAA